MDFIFNSRQKKVEVFYESQEELDQILDLIKKYGQYKETQLGGIISSSDWMNIQTIPCSNTHSINQPHLPTCSSISSEDVPTVTFDSSDEGGYSCLTASVPHKTK